MGLDLVFETKDKKYITAGAVTDKEWLGMCTAFNKPELLTDDRFSTPRARFDNKTERRIIIANEIKKHNCLEILKKLHENEVPSAPILTREELLENEQIVENKIIEFHDSKIFGKVRSPRPAPIYSESDINGAQLAPLLGENSIEILEELEFTKNEIETFIKDKTISIAN